ncbi:uncharacterized protein GGS22DRAFT_163191 [Annulohypoxylon maeteangense]|uniref:uncharacterized protein n=1 Tax=Annulohypoxylon maeteangense TaxID=1927788 RepID=UPI00200882B4|nr:uncharacterized protein GGS22DRAFT_163191 [Annulohypoxylon maeteangense]KAI0885241.1 hypothetical protein GGS22DRAFT_163191 [Annulohypoxylon maeteangense]
MRPQPILFAAVALLASNVIAQDATTTTAATSNRDTTTSAATTTAASTTTDRTTAEETTTSENTSSAESTTSDRTSSDRTTTTARSTTTDASSTDSVPTITSTSSEPLPTLSGQYSYPAPSVPPTNNAPFMQPSSVPEGTVFIAVGAILGAFGAAVLIWRAVVAWLLHRNVKKAALAQQVANDKATFQPPPPPFYKYTDQASSASLGGSVPGRGVRRTTRGPIPSSTPSQSNLFFSPTAPTASSNGNRESRFLPSGFYAAGAGSPQQQGHNHSISLTNLRPDSRGHGRPLGHTPPESPSLAPRQDMARRNMSASSLNLNRPPSGRAPSAFLEDLLDDPQNQFPPPGHPNTWSQAQTRH